MVNKKRLIKLTQQLIRINSENPPGNEYRIAIRVKDYLEDMGFKTRTYEFADKRTNVMGILEGNKTKKSLLLALHLDTVPAGRNWRFPPYQAKIYKGRIYGRGATDCKGNLASSLEAIRSLKERKIKLDYNLIFLATADEETGSKFGLIPLLEKRIVRPDVAIILDADDFGIIIAQKGLIHFKIKVSGKKAHGAYPENGINAIEIAVEIIRKLKELKLSSRPHPLLKLPTINVGTIKGGDKVNVVADWCEFEVDLRFLPGMNPEDILKKIRRVIKKYTDNFKIEVQDVQRPYRIDRHHLLVDSMVKAIRKVGLKPKIKGSHGATVITFFQDKGIPAIATGFGVTNCAHKTDEYAMIRDLYAGARMLEIFLRNFNFNFKKINLR